jgi:hypothetical protein
MTDGAAIKEAAAINAHMISTMLVIYRIAHRALSTEKRIGQRIQRDARAEIEGLLVQMMAIEKLALSSACVSRGSTTRTICARARAACSA